MAAAGLWIWVADIAMSLLLAQGVATTPQPNQRMWVLVSEWLPAVPVAAAIVAALVSLFVRRRGRPATVAAVNAFLWFSLAVAFVAVPKAP